MAKKRKKNTGIGAATGAVVGGSAGYQIGKHKAKIIELQNVLRRRGQKTVRKEDEILRRTIREGQRRAEFMNIFRPKGSSRFQFNIDPKAAEQKMHNQRYLNKSLKSTKGIIAKWAIPPAVVGGVVGNFLEKKAEGDLTMSKANEVMEKLAAGGWLKVITGVANRAKVLGGVAGKPMAKAMQNKTMKQLDHMGKVQASRAAKAQAKLDAGVGSSQSLANQAVKLDDAQRATKAIDRTRMIVDDIAKGKRDHWQATDRLNDIADNFKNDMSTWTKLTKYMPGFGPVKPKQLLKEPRMPKNMIEREIHSRGGEQIFKRTVEKLNQSDLPSELKGLVGKGK